MTLYRTLGMAALTAGAIGFAASACSDSSAGPDGGLGGASHCACSGDQTESWTLDCYCAEFECPTLEEVLEDPFCPEFTSEYGEPEMVTGCGRITVSLPWGLSGKTYVYAEANHELISASNFDDVPHGSCDTWEYVGGVTDFEDCADEDAEPLCP